MSIHELRATRAKNFDAFKALATKADFDAAKDQPEYDRLKKEIELADAEITRAIEARELEAKTAQPVAGQEASQHASVAATVKSDPWTNDGHAQARGLGTSKGLILAGVAKMIGAGGGSYHEARNEAKALYGENHPVTKALMAGLGSAGGFLVPPDYVNEVIELLRPATVVRAAGPRNLPMPRGTLTLPAQTSAASASYGNEVTPPVTSQPKVGQIVATYKKLKALVPTSNDLLRYADPAADAFVRDDLVKVMALREDLAFLTGDGTQDSPRGYLSFANEWAKLNGGVAGVWNSTGNSTLATSGNFITSNETYTLTTVANELAGAVNRLDVALVPDSKRIWFFHPRIFNYLNNVLNSLGVYVYRDELSKGTLLGYPFKKTTQIPANLNGSATTTGVGTFILLAEMTETLLLDSMQLELAVSREGAYTDTQGVTQSAFANDQTIIRAITEHDFQLRHPAAVAVIQDVQWAPAIQ